MAIEQQDLIEAIQQPLPVLEACGWRRLPILLRQHRPESGEGGAPGLLAQGQIHPFSAFSTA